MHILTKVHYKMLTVEHGIHIIYRLFTGSHNRMALHYGSYKKSLGRILLNYSILGEMHIHG